MSVNVVLKSSKSLNYFNGVADFFVNWNNFIPEDESYCEYNLTFSFITERNATNGNKDIYSLEVDLGTNLQIMGSSNSNQNANAGTDNTIGFVQPNQLSDQVFFNSFNSWSLLAEHNLNAPVTCKGRPSNNNVKITLRDLFGVITEKTPVFLLILRFEKIKKDQY